MLDCANEGLTKQSIADRRLRRSEARYLSYAVDEDDWVPDGDQAWAGVTGRALYPERVKMARTDDIDEYHRHEVY